MIRHSGQIEKIFTTMREELWGEFDRRDSRQLINSLQMKAEHIIQRLSALEMEFKEQLGFA